VTKPPRKPTVVPPPARPKPKLPAPTPAKRRASTVSARPKEEDRAPARPRAKSRAMSELDIEIEIDEVAVAGRAISVADDQLIEVEELARAGELPGAEAEALALAEAALDALADEAGDALDALVMADEADEAGDALDALAGEADEEADALALTDEEAEAAEPEDDDAPAEIPALTVAVFDEAAALGALGAAIAAAGHVAAVTGAGPDGLERVRRALAGEVDAAIVALPGGESLIEGARALAPRRPIVIAAVAGPAITAARRAAAAGADLVAVRPLDAEHLAPVLLAAARLAGARRAAIAARDAAQLLRARLEALVEPEPGALQPYEQFQRVFEGELKRARRYAYPISVALFAVDLPPPAPPPGVRGILRARAGTVLTHTIRDIDVATSLPLDVSRSYDSAPSSDERFLVLLPYTDLGGAALLARRVIAAVAEGAPVVAGGRSFSPRFIGAVAGAAPGQALSFSRLMKDATRSLEQARKDGAELTVPEGPD
jgi:hypothetical protein